MFGFLFSTSIFLFQDASYLLVPFGMFLVVLYLFKYVSLASMCATIISGLYITALMLGFNVESISVIVASWLMTVLVIYRHRTNIEKKSKRVQKIQFHGYRKFLRNFLFFCLFSHWNRIIVCMNYLYYEYKSSTVCTVTEDEKLYYKSLSTQNYLNEKCLLNGSSLKGRQEAFVYQMKVKKYIPVVVSISRKEIYFPNKSKKST